MIIDKRLLIILSLLIGYYFLRKSSKAWFVIPVISLIPFFIENTSGDDVSESILTSSYPYSTSTIG